MSDIVEKLRNPSGDGDATLVMLAAMREAATEIERLRADNERLTDKLAKIAEQENYK